MITLDDIFAFVKKILGNPVFQFIYPFLIFLLGYLIVDDGKSLSYQILSSQEVRKEVSNEELVLLENEQIEECNRDYIALFNKGDELIDSDDFLGEDHIRLSLEGSSIINVEVYKKSRKELITSIEKDSLRDDMVKVNLVNGEVFEKNDALVLEILYCGSLKSTWLFQSRIKGLPEGLSKGEIHKNEDEVINWIIIISIGLISILTFRLILFRIQKKKFVLRRIELYIILTFVAMSAIMIYEYLQDRAILKVFELN